MTKIAIKGCAKNWKISIGTFFVLLFAAFFIGIFSLLFINIFTIRTTDGNGVAGSMPFFAIIFVVAVFISVIALYSVLKLNIQLKWQQYLDLRIIGFGFKRIRMIVFIENIFIAICAIVIASVAANFLYSYLLLYFSNQKLFGLAVDFQNSALPSYSGVYVIIVFLIVMIILYFAILPIKELRICSTDSFLGNHVGKHIAQLIFGLVFAALWLLLSFIKPKQDIATILFGQIFYVVAFALLGTYVLRILLGFINSLTRLTGCSALPCRDLLYSVKQHASIVLMIVMIVVFLNLSTSSMPLLENMMNNSIGALALSTLAYVLTITVVSFSVIIIINSLIMYFVSKVETYNDLRIIGYTKFKIHANIFWQTICVVAIGVFFGLLAALLSNLMISGNNNMGLIAFVDWRWIVITVIVIFFVSLMTSGLTIASCFLTKLII